MPAELVKGGRGPDLVGKIARDYLDARLKEWAKEYGGSRYENIGFRSRNLLQRLIEHGGFVPDSGGFRPVPIRTAADEVETIVLRMERAWFANGRVLRCEFYAPNMAMEARLEVLRQIGLPMSRTGYYDKLDAAKMFVAGALP